MTRPRPEDVEQIAVVGAGTIGASWAALFLSRGYGVRAYDPSPTFETYVRDYIETAWPSLEALGLSAGADPGRIVFHGSPAEAVDGADFVQESVPERLEVKHALYAEIEPAMAPDVVIASSSSGFMPSEFQAGTAHPERFVLAHPFNPPHLVPLVEVLGGAATDPAAVDWAYAFYAGCGKDPIRLKKEVPGHVANRLQAAMWREAIHLVASGVASVSDVDKAITAGPGLRWAIMGPHMTFHLASGGAGMRVFAERYRDAHHRWWDDLGRPYLTPEVVDALCEGLEEEEAGRSFEEIAAERDRKLVRLLDALKD